MKDLKLFLDLIRIEKPIGIMLLFWPCLWGLTLGNDFSDNNLIYLTYIAYFFLGSILMRSAGCIVNDILDRKYDILVDRTKNRPIASGKISTKLGLTYAIVLCFMAFLILIQFNLTTILLGLASMPFAFSYPLMKRYTYWPQLFLGFTFNYGLIIIFYFGAIFWTLAYDTIYGFQDIKDDEIIGVKSTSIKFKNNPKLFIFLCYLIFIFIQIFSGVLMEFNYYYFIGIIVIALHLLIFQTLKLDVSNTKMCLAKFKSNNFLGLLIFLNILINKIYL